MVFNFDDVVPTKEEKEIVMKKIMEFEHGPYGVDLICYLLWESRSGAIDCMRRVSGDPQGEILEDLKLEWDYEQGIGFGDNQIIKFIGKFPEGEEFEKDSQIQIMSKVVENRIVL
jgi:hypothetical protein